MMAVAPRTRSSSLGTRNVAADAFAAISARTKRTRRISGFELRTSQPEDCVHDPPPRFDDTGHGPANLRPPHSPSICHRDLGNSRAKLKGPDLHLHRPPVAAVAHVDALQHLPADGAEWPE